MTSPKRYVCVHGHFYQPPRENPWTERVEIQDSAAPYHDWNERIAAECYSPNAWARILDDAGRIARLANNFARISFNVGPTLMTWLERRAPATYEAILAADREAIRRHGCGAAIAQAYGHAILPLCDDRDRRTHVAWGVDDFRHRFGRDPEGMWLPETAVDLPTLDVLAEFGIRFTILAPSQARRVRPAGRRSWTDVANGSVDPRVPYRVALPSGRSIVVWFYDGALSSAVAFERALDDGAGLARRIRAAFDGRTGPQVVHLATDGETFGHHHRFGEMALAFALDDLDREDGVTVAPYGRVLRDHEVDHEAEIVERTAWSCAHGLGRWSDDCGCSTGAHPRWRQTWRRPLRAALERLRDRVAPAWEREAGRHLGSPWEARDGSLAVVRDRSPETVRGFLERHALPAVDGDGEGAIEVLALLELQRMLLLSFTSCGWFFDDVSGIETVQVLQYAARAIDLARERLGLDLEAEFLADLAAIPSNDPERGDARAVFGRDVAPSRVDAGKVAAHAVVAAMFETDGIGSLGDAFVVQTADWRASRTGRPRHASGVLSVRDRRTGRTGRFAAAAVHLGGPHLLGGVRPLPPVPREDDVSALATARSAVDDGDVAGIVRAFERVFPDATFSIGSLRPDQRRRVAHRLLDDALRDAEHALERLYHQHAPTLRLLADADVPLSGALRDTARLAVHAALRRRLREARPDPAEVRERVREARGAGVEVDDPTVRREAERAIERLARQAVRAPDDPAEARRLQTFVEAVRPVAPDLHLARVLVHDAPFPPGEPWDALFAALGFAPSARGTGRPRP